MRCLSLLVAALVAFHADAGDLRIGGGFAPINNIFKKIQAPFEAKTGIKLILNEDGPDLALKALDEGRLDMASAGLGSEEWLKLMDERKIALKNRAEMKYRVVGFDLVGIILHPGIKLSAMSNEQLEKVFLGQARNWKELGAADQAIVVVMGEKIPGANRIFAQRVLKGADYRKDALWLADGTAPALAAKVRSTPGAISLAPMGMDSSGLSVPVIDKIGRPVTAATRGVPSADAEALYRFISGEGKQFIK